MKNWILIISLLATRLYRFVPHIHVHSYRNRMLPSYFSPAAWIDPIPPSSHMMHLIFLSLDDNKKLMLSSAHVKMFISMRTRAPLLKPSPQLLIIFSNHDYECICINDTDDKCWIRCYISLIDRRLKFFHLFNLWDESKDGSSNRGVEVKWDVIMKIISLCFLQFWLHSRCLWFGVSHENFLLQYIVSRILIFW